MPDGLRAAQSNALLDIKKELFDILVLVKPRLSVNNVFRLNSQTEEISPPGLRFQDAQFPAESDIPPGLDLTCAKNITILPMKLLSDHVRALKLLLAFSQTGPLALDALTQSSTSPVLDNGLALDLVPHSLRIMDLKAKLVHALFLTVPDGDPGDTPHAHVLDVILVSESENVLEVMLRSELLVKDLLRNSFHAMIKKLSLPELPV